MLEDRTLYVIVLCPAKSGGREGTRGRHNKAYRPMKNWGGGGGNCPPYPTASYVPADYC